LIPDSQDPFDRVLIALATVEDLELVTVDGDIPRYASARVRCFPDLRLDDAHATLRRLEGHHARWTG
jgi:hypothetical protein